MWCAPFLWQALRANSVFSMSSTSSYKQLFWGRFQKLALLFIYWRRFYLFIFREMGRERDREGEKHFCVREKQLPLTCPQPRTWPTTQACALTGNWTGDLSALRPALSTSEQHQPGHKEKIRKEKHIKLLAWVISKKGNGIQVGEGMYVGFPRHINWTSFLQWV